jgi:hypothetical protein
MLHFSWPAWQALTLFCIAGVLHVLDCPKSSFSGNIYNHESKNMFSESMAPLTKGTNSRGRKADCPSNFFKGDLNT